MLVIAENMKDVPTKPKEVLYVREGGVRKKINRKSKGKGKDKGVAWKKNLQPPKKKKENPTKDANCFHCGNKGTGRETIIPTLLNIVYCEPDKYNFLIEHEEGDLRDHDKPRNYKETVVTPESNKWHEASMKDNQV
uniref:Zinc finger, CCHC-type n=1 Tax=Tanacetum cinerariifolium TaxID=118510 RepID=A0A6L2JW34_TANCI|nr:hypothetical protein [Tanacetum cinerariifolium]